MYPSQVEFLHHILDECNYLLKQYKEYNFDDLTNNKTLSHAVCRSLEIIGEASKNVNTNLKLKYPLIDWKRMAGIRDVIIHDYFGLDFEIIWDTIKTDIPVLMEWIKIIIEKKPKYTTSFVNVLQIGKIIKKSFVFYFFKFSSSVIPLKFRNI